MTSAVPNQLCLKFGANIKEILCECVNNYKVKSSRPLKVKMEVYKKNVVTKNEMENQVGQTIYREKKANPILSGVRTKS